MPELLKAILSATSVLGILGILFGILLALTARVFGNKEDERDENRFDCRKDGNCSACRNADCTPFVGAEFDGEVDGNEKKIVCVQCGGTLELTRSKYQYQGIADCMAAASLLDGNLHCGFGCLGLGSCAAVCEREAITVVNGVASVDHSLCDGCGSCVDACPKHLIDLVPLTAKFVVSCKSTDTGSKVQKSCLAGCVGCKVCEENCTYDAIHVINNLAQIDYDKCTHCGACAEKCPANIIRGVL